MGHQLSAEGPGKRGPRTSGGDASPLTGAADPTTRRGCQPSVARHSRFLEKLETDFISSDLCCSTLTDVRKATGKAVAGSGSGAPVCTPPPPPPLPHLSPFVTRHLHLPSAVDVHVQGDLCNRRDGSAPGLLGGASRPWLTPRGCPRPAAGPPAFQGARLSRDSSSETDRFP